jgi:hypothetical protein
MFRDPATQVILGGPSSVARSGFEATPLSASAWHDLSNFLDERLGQVLREDCLNNATRAVLLQHLLACKLCLIRPGAPMGVRLVSPACFHPIFRVLPVILGPLVVAYGPLTPCCPRWRAAYVGATFATNSAVLGLL